MLHPTDYVEQRTDVDYNTAYPCYEGDGFARVLSVGPAKTFQSVVIGLVTFTHAFYVLYAIKTGKADTQLVDKLEGMSNMIMIMLFLTALFWGTQDLTEQEFVTHGNSTEKDGNFIRHFYPNKDLLATFAAQTIFSTFALLSEIGLCYGLMFWKDELIADSGGGFNGFENFSSSGNVPAPYKGEASEPAHYSDL